MALAGAAPSGGAGSTGDSAWAREAADFRLTPLALAGTLEGPEEGSEERKLFLRGFFCLLWGRWFSFASMDTVGAEVGGSVESSERKLFLRGFLFLFFCSFASRAALGAEVEGSVESSDRKLILRFFFVSLDLAGALDGPASSSEESSERNDCRLPRSFDACEARAFLKRFRAFVRSRACCRVTAAWQMTQSVR